ncbi:MAG: hypothetical protein ABIQ35_09685 [Verrucomicrobiota bacterium]
MRKINYGGWSNCIELSNGEIDLVATTDVGPRIIRFGFAHGKNLFKEFPDQVGKTGGSKWVSYGGHRFWHAPEVMPRTYAPDNLPIEHQWDGTMLKLIQPVEASTGLQKEIEITLSPNENRAKVLHRLTNRNLWPIEAAPWALSVVDGPGRAIFPQEPVSNGFLPVRPLALWGYTDMADSRYVWGKKFIQVKCDPKSGSAQKIGIMNTAGWAAYARADDLFIKRFGFLAGAPYPDFGCNTECYTNGDMLEVETLGPLGKLAPGGAVEHIEHWFLFKADIGLEESAMEQNLLPLLKASSAS